MKKKYDIAFFPDSLGRGGAERVTIHLSEYFASKGKKVAIITSNAKREGEYDTPYNVDRICVNCDKKSIIQLILGYKRVFKNYDISVGIIMGLPQCSFIVPASVKNKMKIIVSERNSPDNFDGRKLTKLLMRFFMRCADGYIFQTIEARKYYKKLRDKQVAVIPNPIDTRIIPSRKCKTNIENIISVGRLASQKNHTLLINSFKNVLEKYPNCKLTIYGEGENREDLENLINKLSLNNHVFLPGTKKNILEIEAESGLFVFSSNFEGIPNALLEAMSIGLPCVSTDCPCGGPASVIKNGKNGILVPVNNSIEMSKAIIYMLENRDHAYKMGNMAKKIKSELNIANIGNQWLEFIRTIK